ncbi:type II secretion system protein M [Serratia entomophila]|uniref:type II secretion system protein M n=1 Tax=Serratia entomophila TaxID=42906 RepID=UPI002178410A|nr:type II secretion system protein M [Serratia entomophila]CAI1736686.1 General secretion pathway, M protein [Serratia entomophila]
MKQRIADFRVDKRLQAAVAWSLLLLAAFGYCLYQFYLMKQHAQRLEALNGRVAAITQLRARLPPTAAPASLLQQRLRQSAQERQIPIAHLSDSEQGVQIILPALPFGRLIAWLAELQREQGIRVVRLAVEREQQPGRVKVLQLLVRAQPPIL